MQTPAAAPEDAFELRWNATLSWWSRLCLLFNGGRLSMRVCSRLVWRPDSVGIEVLGTTCEVGRLPEQPKTPALKPAPAG